MPNFLTKNRPRNAQKNKPNLHKTLYTTVLVAAAGNEAGRGGDNPIVYPAAYDSVLSVTGLNEDDVKNDVATFNDKVDLSAPIKAWGAHWDGAFVPNYNYAFLGSDPGALFPCPLEPAGQDLLFLGTSFSAPLVAGAAALVKVAYPNMTNQEIAAKLKSSTDSIYHLQGNFPFVGKLGTGRLNAFKAVTFFDTIPKAAAETTLSGTVYVSGDLFIPAGKKVTLNPGTVLKFYPGDIFNKGVSGGKEEIIVKGTLVAKGTPANPIQFVSFNSAPSDSDWHSVRILPGGSGKFENCIFKSAYAALDYKNSAADTVKYCVFEKNFMYGIVSANPNLKVIADTFRDNSNYGGMTRKFG